MVSEEEIHHCVRRGDYYVIRPMLPELLDPDKEEQNVFTKEYSSEDRVLDFEGTQALLKNHRLLIDQVVPNSPDLLR